VSGGQTREESLAGAPQPAVTYVVHGEPTAAAALRDRIDAELGWMAVVLALGERVIVRSAGT
jgi:metallo-beta-lactamase family protein